MKTAIAILVAAIVALYLYNNQSPRVGQIGKPAAATSHSPTLTVTHDSTQSSQSQTEAKIPQTSSRIVEPGPSAPRSTSVVVAPMPKLGLKTGPNAQTDLKTGPNAQNAWIAQSTLKTGPNAQTDLTMKRSW